MQRALAVAHIAIAMLLLPLMLFPLTLAPIMLIGPVWAILLARRLWRRDPTVIRTLRRTARRVPCHRCAADLVRRLDAEGR